MRLWIILFIPFIIALAYAVHSAFKYTRMISNIFLSLVYRPAPEFYTAHGERMVILDSKDREIETLLVEKKGSHKLLIFCHESGASKESWEKYAYFIPALGYHLLSVDFNNNSESGKNSLSQWPTSPDVERLLTVVRWAKTALGADLEIVLFGVSNGADIALAASFDYPGVAGVIADGLFSMKEIFRDYIRKWGPVLVKRSLFGEHYPAWVVNAFATMGFWHCQRRSGKRFIDIEKFLHRKRVPLLMIHGAEDDYVPEPHQALLEKMSDKGAVVHHVVVPMAKHNEAVLADRTRYERAVAEFLKGILP